MNGASRSASRDRQRSGGPLFWSSAALGAAIIALGVRGILDEAAATKPRQLARWFFGAGLTHDFVWIPVLLVVGYLTHRLPDVARNPIRIGLVTSTVLTVVTWPLVKGWGRRATNPSALPLDYGRNLVLCVAACWLTVAGTVAVRVWRQR